jgi:hypothetical protein
MASSLLTYCPQCGALMNRRWAACAVCGGAMTPCEDEVPLQETTPATPATQESHSSKGRESSRGAVPSARAEDAPAQYWSDVLYERFWVTPTDAHAVALAAQGQGVYQPDEIWLLRDLKARDPHTFPAKLRAIHQVKTIFGATVTHEVPITTARPARRAALERPVKPRDPRLGPILPPCATCGELRYWHDHETETWQCWTCIPPVPRRHSPVALGTREKES